jgi:hypothetical protein
MTEFTPGQFTLMRAMYDQFRLVDEDDTDSGPTPAPPTDTAPTPTAPPPTPPTRPTQPTPIAPTRPIEPTPTPPVPVPPTPTPPSGIVPQNAAQAEAYEENQEVVTEVEDSVPPPAPVTTCRGRRDDGLPCAKNWQCCSRICSGAARGFRPTGECVSA